MQDVPSMVLHDLAEPTLRQCRAACSCKECSGTPLGSWTIKSGHRQRLNIALSLPRIAIAIACNGLRDCVAIAVALPSPLPLSLPSPNTAFNAYFGQQQAAQPSQSSTIGFSNMTFSLLSFSRPLEAQASRSYGIAVVDCWPLPCNGNGIAHTHCTPVAGPLPFVAIELAAFLHCHCRCIAHCLWPLLPVEEPYAKARKS
jgi:hypothetical protein